MNFRIADTFTDSLARLTGDEQKSVKTTAFDLQMNAASTGLSFHKLDRARDRNFWSVRVSGDVRLIVHKTADSLLHCYVDHHDIAYAWAERRRLEPLTATEDSIFDLSEHLPREAAEALLERNVASASWPTQTSWNSRSRIRGKSGRSFFIRRSGSS